MHQDDKVIIYNKGDVIFAFNFHPFKSFDSYFIPTPKKGNYKVILSSDDGIFGGQDRIDKEYKYETTENADKVIGFNCYLPSRTVAVFKKVRENKKR